jgi:hypothetical protein
MQFQSSFLAAASDPCLACCTLTANAGHGRFDSFDAKKVRAVVVIDGGGGSDDDGGVVHCKALV